MFDPRVSGHLVQGSLRVDQEQRLAQAEISEVSNGCLTRMVCALNLYALKPCEGFIVTESKNQATTNEQSCKRHAPSAHDPVHPRRALKGL